MAEILNILAQVFLLYLLADVIGGVLHWAEDTLGSAETPVWGVLFVKPNIRHHEKPASILANHWLRSNSLTVGLALAVVSGLWAMQGGSWQLILLGVFGGMNQQVHRFAHTRHEDLPLPVRFLQNCGIFQGAQHHWIHHRKPNNRYFCVMTPIMNPLLEKVGFWSLLERLLVPVFGAPRRKDLSCRSWYKSRPFWASI